VAGRSFFVVVVHLSSKIGDDREFGSRQPPRWVTEEGRTAQAQFVRDLAERVLDLDPAARVIVLGDFNELDDRPALQLLTSGRLSNLVATLPRAELYSHTFNGNGQQIDHILVSPALVAGAEVDVVHCNVDLPAAERASDHDPVVARLPLR
jgi:predicted extracellular nuclease